MGVAWMGDCGILAAMTPATDSPPPQPGPAAQDALGRGVYDAVGGLGVVDATPVSTRKIQFV